MLFFVSIASLSPLYLPLPISSYLLSICSCLLLCISLISPVFSSLQASQPVSQPSSEPDRQTLSKLSSQPNSHSSIHSSIHSNSHSNSQPAKQPVKEKTLDIVRQLRRNQSLAQTEGIRQLRYKEFNLLKLNCSQQIVCLDVK